LALGRTELGTALAELTEAWEAALGDPELAAGELALGADEPQAARARPNEADPMAARKDRRFRERGCEGLMAAQLYGTAVSAGICATIAPDDPT